MISITPGFTPISNKITINTTNYFIKEIYRLVLKTKKVADIDDYLQSMQVYRDKGYIVNIDTIDIFIEHHYVS